MFEAPVDRLRGTVAGAGPVEEREHVDGALLQCPAELAQFDKSGRDTACEGVDELLHDELPESPIRFPVGGDHPLIDAPGRLDLDMLLVGEQLLEAGLLLLGEQPGSGVEGAAGLVERILLPSAAPECVTLDAAAALVERVASQSHDVERVHHRDRVGEFLDGSGLEPGEPVHRDNLDTIAPGLGTGGEPGLEHALGTPLDHVQQP